MPNGDNVTLLLAWRFTPDPIRPEPRTTGTMITMGFMGQDMRRVAVQQRASMLLSERQEQRSDRAGQRREDFAAEADDDGGGSGPRDRWVTRPAAVREQPQRQHAEDAAD
jgi:hypothetical protein